MAKTFEVYNPKYRSFPPLSLQIHFPPNGKGGGGRKTLPQIFLGVYNSKSCIFKALSRFLMKFKGGQKTLQEIIPVFEWNLRGVQGAKFFGDYNQKY